MTVSASMRPIDGFEDAPLLPAVARFRGPVLRQSVWQCSSTLGAYIAVSAAMYASVAISYWLTLGFAFLAAGLVVRIFIIQHDCGHRSFFRSRRANNALGMVCSIVTMAPYAHWRRQHAGHHAHWNNLDRRYSGLDIYSSCMTVAEYRALSRPRRFVLRSAHHPLVSAILLPPLIFFLLYRVPFDTPKAWRHERRAVYATDLAIAATFTGLGLLFGFERVLAVHAPVMVVASIVGVWIFSVQHRFEGTLWLRQNHWTFESASLRGSSYLRLPRILQWFTGNIGFHHVHHLNPHVPNYRLEACHRAIPALQQVPTLGIRSGMRALTFALWDEQCGRMVSFRTAAAQQRASRAAPQPSRPTPAGRRRGSAPG
jgi:omega-6 fatty acid desaturase (delta-12 desaturase)